MKVIVEFDTDNAAFEDNGLEEYDRLLAGAAIKAYNLVKYGGLESYPLRDNNGNTVGSVHLGDSSLERDAIAKKARQAEKRKWFEKVKTREFWLALAEGVDGPEGVGYAEEVYNILYEIFGERG